MKTKTKRKKYNWKSNEVLVITSLARWGFSANCIARKLNMSIPQIYYICNRQKVKIRDYREGKNSIAKRVLSRY